ncbi:MAG: topoisomerase C-terminal repeat-containing protein, partial [Gammaproteobacteria bacterium]
IRGDDPYTIGLERALELIEEKKIADANRIIQDFADQGIQVLNGRYGPYVTDGNKNARVPKDREPKDLTLDECKELIANAPERRGRRGAKKKTAKKTTAKKTAKKKSTKKKTKTKKKKKKKKNAAAKKRKAKPTSEEGTANAEPAMVGAAETPE